MTAASEGGIYSQYAQSNTGLHCTDQAHVTNFIKILDNPGRMRNRDWFVGAGLVIFWLMLNHICKPAPTGD